MVENGDDPFPPLRVSWDHNVDPPIPLVTETVTMSDGQPGIVMFDRDESLRRMWAYIEATHNASPEVPNE